MKALRILVRRRIVSVCEHGLRVSLQVTSTKHGPCDDGIVGHMIGMLFGLVWVAKKYPSQEDTS